LQRNDESKIQWVGICILLEQIHDKFVRYNEAVNWEIPGIKLEYGNGIYKEEEEEEEEDRKSRQVNLISIGIFLM
jgi:hypothetical protein